jgi:hypothetical protein
MNLPKPGRARAYPKIFNPEAKEKSKLDSPSTAQRSVKDFVARLKRVLRDIGGKK